MSALSHALKVPASTWADLDAIARQAGITPRQASMARAGKQIHAGAHLALCATIGIDPIDGKMRPVKVLSPNVVWWAFVRRAVHHALSQEARSACCRQTDWRIASKRVPNRTRTAGEHRSAS